MRQTPMSDQPMMPIEELRPRELEILRLIADGLSNDDIAQHLHIAVTTVRWHNRQMYSKLGVHSRTKAVAHARKLGILGPQPAPTASSTSASTTRQHNLPAEVTPFIGRRSELDTIREVMDAARLLTLMGPGGIGKTRLALHVAHDLYSHYADGVWFVALAGVSSIETLITTIADTVGCQLFGRKAPNEQLHDFLRDKEMLLVLDNFEHLLDGSLEIRQILEEAPRVKVLVTSRERLNLKPETVFVLDGLDIPQGTREDLPEHFGAIQLFLQTAQRIDVDFQIQADTIEPIIDICQIVEGVPLAIELAAAWIKLLSPTEIFAEIESGLDILKSRLRDIPERHHSIRAVFDTTWKRLPEPEKDVLAALSVFQGSFTRHAAQAITSTSLSTLMSMADKSLISRAEDDRFQLHELLRRYGGEKLEAMGIERVNAAQHAHATYYCQLVASQQTELARHRQMKAAGIIENDFANIRKAWLWATAHQAFTLIELAFDALNLYCSLHSRFHEWVGLLQAVLAHEDALSHELQAATHIMLGRTHGSVGNYPIALEHIERGLALARQMGNTDRQIEALIGIGRILCRQGDYPNAEPIIVEAKLIAEESNNPLHMAETLWSMGDIVNHKGDYAIAERYCQEALEIYQEMEDWFSAAHCLNALGINAKDQGRYAEAKDYYLESLAIRRQLNHRRGIAACLLNLGEVAADSGETVAAREYYTQSLAIRRDIGDRWGVASCLGSLGLLVDDVEAARAYQEESLTIFREIGSKQGMANSLSNLGDLWRRQRAYEEAERHYDEALTLYRELSYIVGEATCLTGIGHLERDRSNLRRAWKAYCASLQVVSETVPTSLIAIVGLASIAATSRFYNEAGQWLGFAMHHVAADADVIAFGSQLREQLDKDMSAENLDLVLKAGKGLTIEQVLANIDGLEPSIMACIE